MRIFLRKELDGAWSRIVIQRGTPGTPHTSFSPREYPGKLRSRGLLLSLLHVPKPKVGV